MMALFGIVNTFGTDVIAAYSVAGRIDSIAALPAMNFSAALATFVGQNLGANKLSRVKGGLHATLFMSSVVSVIVTIFVFFFGKFFMGLFTPDQEVIRIGHEYLVIVSSFYLILSALFTTSGVMRGAGDTIIPMFITLFSLWIVRIPLSYLLSKNMGETGIWWAVPIGWGLGLVISYSYYLTGRWKLKVVVKHENAGIEEVPPVTAKTHS
jgi:Na+-driven multidrug efflux pump